MTVMLVSCIILDSTVIGRDFFFYLFRLERRDQRFTYHYS